MYLINKNQPTRYTSVYIVHSKVHGKTDDNIKLLIFYSRRLSSSRNRKNKHYFNPTQFSLWVGQMLNRFPTVAEAAITDDAKKTAEPSPPTTRSTFIYSGEYKHYNIQQR
jgi:hypothetical protein